MSAWVGLFKIPSDWSSRYDLLFCSKTQKIKDLSEVDPELLRTFEKLGVSLTEQNDYQTSQLIIW
jgi:hypothetical protein